MLCMIMIMISLPVAAVNLTLRRQLASWYCAWAVVGSVRACCMRAAARHVGMRACPARCWPVAMIASAIDIDSNWTHTSLDIILLL